MILKTKPPMVQNNIGTRLAMSTPVPACLGRRKRPMEQPPVLVFWKTKQNKKNLRVGPVGEAAPNFKSFLYSPF